MKLISWNVNGLRACMGKGFSEFLNDASPDVLCLQETKMQPDQADFEFPGYRVFWNAAEKKGYSGTAILTKTEPLSVRYGIGLAEADAEGRVLTAEYPAFFLVCVYVPNAQDGLKRIEFRMAFDDAFREYLETLHREKPVIVCGDMNVAHRFIDIKNAKTNIGNAGFSYEERGKFSELLASGFVDSFRRFYPDKTDAYSWWSYRGNARENNVGWRIDYFLVTEDLLEKLTGSAILSQVTGSDHCPVVLELEA